MYQQGDTEAQSIMHRAAKVLAQMIITATVAIGPRTVLLGGRMVDFSEGSIVTLIDHELRKYKSFVGKLDVRCCTLEENRSQILGAVAYTLQNIDI